MYMKLVKAHLKKNNEKQILKKSKFFDILFISRSQDNIVRTMKFVVEIACFMIDFYFCLWKKWIKLYGNIFGVYWNNNQVYNQLSILLGYMVTCSSSAKSKSVYMFAACFVWFFFFFNNRSLFQLHVQFTV